MKIGFLLNPLAGMGGSLGLGGSDGRTLFDFIVLKAEPVARNRALIALKSIQSHPCFDQLRFCTCSGEMGADALNSLQITNDVVLDIHGESKASDTQEACRKFLALGIDLILFVGGDGTARDVLSVIGRKVPILGIPSGVKMHSSVFVHTPDETGHAMQIFFETRKTVEGEVMDVDEEAFRAGRVSAKFYGAATIPDVSELFQSGKSPTDRSSEADEIEELTEYVFQNLDQNTLYFLGTGSTVAAISRKLGIEKNELTINAVLGGKNLGEKLSEIDILHMINQHERFMIIVTPIGGQGFVFGRGNQQFSSRVLALTDNDNIQIIATPSKLNNLKLLRVDTGEMAIDARLRGFWKVLTGYAKYKVMQIQ